jgi:Bacterial alpha-L-rhamnosidase 6 hairpin glycosidase domain
VSPRSISVVDTVSRRTGRLLTLAVIGFAGLGPPVGKLRAQDWSISAEGEAGTRVFTLRSGATLRDGIPAGGERLVHEDSSARPWITTGSVELDGLYALALEEVAENSVDEVSDKSYRNGEPLRLQAFQTGRLWRYVWTRDLAYACDLGLARFDLARAVSSLRFKVSSLKAEVEGVSPQIVQDTGSGGSYPVSTDRVVWALGARAVVMESSDRADFRAFAYDALSRTLEQDAVLVRDPADGLYRGETSFLDWREQTYPEWTARDVVPIARSKALSTNVLYFIAMKTAAEFAGKLGRDEEAKHWSSEARRLRTAIRDKFFTELPPPAFILCGDSSEIAVPHRDLLGESLAVLHEVTDSDESRRISGSYPLGARGPSVVWPNSRKVPIYHNLGIWPFVSAYYVKAAAEVGNTGGLVAGFRSLVDGAALNLSNMENLDWASGAASGDYEGLHGPVINSQRQLWSVAGFLSVVQDVLFGFGVTPDGVEVSPTIPRALKDEMFPASNTIRLQNLVHRNQRHDITVYFPEAPDGEEFQVASVMLNGQKVPGRVPHEDLAAENLWEVELVSVEANTAGGTRLISPSDVREVFAPSTPFWRGDALRIEGRRIMLDYGGAGEGEVYRIYRNGEVVAERVTAESWADPQPLVTTGPFPEYAVMVVDAKTGNVSHPTPFRRATPDGAVVVAGFDTGGNAVECDVPRDGDYILAFRYANGAGEIGTGITCGVRHVEVSEVGGTSVSRGYVVFPQTGGPTEFRRSSPMHVALRKGRHVIKLSSGGHAINMSYLEANRDFTEFVGGGEKPFNEFTVESALLEPL